jgi:hypothetical protein
VSEDGRDAMPALQHPPRQADLALLDQPPFAAAGNACRQMGTNFGNRAFSTCEEYIGLQVCAATSALSQPKEAATAGLQRRDYWREVSDRAKDAVIRQ